MLKSNVKLAVIGAAGDMKNHVGALVLLLPWALTGAGGALAADAGVAPDAPATCSEATLRGTYIFAFEGFRGSGKGKGPLAIAGQDVYDGHGTVRSVVTVSANGKIARFVRGTGKYTVDPDCAGSVSFSNGNTIDLFAAPDGSQLALVQTNPGTVASGFEQRVTARKVGD